jgi:hypothetical protein
MTQMFTLYYEVLQILLILFSTPFFHGSRTVLNLREELGSDFMVFLCKRGMRIFSGYVLLILDGL